MDIASLLISVTLGAAAPLAQLPSIARDLASAPVEFRADERAVGNWRIEAARRLDIDLAAAAGILGGRDPRGLGRCVKLNNYWCIKGAGWNGMLAADAEGHAAFSSAVEGAAVAALLLRRYYLEFARRSATDIVTRWAPPQCGAPLPRLVARGGGVGRGPGMAQRRAALGPEPKRVAGLTTRGIGNTLRAHYLAVRRFGARGGLRRSVVADHVGSLIRAPTIAPGFGELASTRLQLAPAPIAALAAPTPLGGGLGPIPSLPPLSCALDGPRLRNYALKVIEGVAASPTEDLKLFTPEGMPNASLARVMENMSGVEIGPLRASRELVRAGIETATAAMRAAHETASPQASTIPAGELRPTN